MRTALLVTTAFFAGAVAGLLFSRFVRPGTDPRREGKFEASPAEEARTAPAFARGGADAPEAAPPIRSLLVEAGDLLQPQAVRRMRIHVSDAAGYLAAAGFESGDLIIGLDGTPFENETQMRALMDGAAIKEQAVLTVLRAGSRLELPFNPRMQRRYAELGGSLRPSSR